MKNLKKISRENLKEIMGGIDTGKKCCAKDPCGNCVLWIPAYQICPTVMIPDC